MTAGAEAGVLRMRAAVLAVCGGLVLGVNGAKAQVGDALYESQRVQRALRERSLEVDPKSEGKRIAYVEVVREDVLADDEIWPTWPNVFHWLTRERVIRRELLLQDGDRYRALRAEESMRNLRALGIFALVRIIPVRTSDPNKVGLLVYTRELWSLRAEVAFAGAGSAFQLTGVLVERNFLGLDKQLSARFDLDPKAYSLGHEYYDPRVLGGELSLDEAFDVILNRSSGHTEGSQGLLTLARPFRNLSQEWSWALSGWYAAYVHRAFRGSEIATFHPDAGGQECDTPDPSCLRSVWDERNYYAGLSGSYRRGERYKQVFTLGASFNDREVKANQETGLQPGQVAVFNREILPKARRQVYPRVGYDLWLPDYVVFHDLSTFGQSESVRVGPSASSNVSLPLRAFGSSTNSVTFFSSIGYVLGDGRSLAEASLAASARLEQDSVVDQAMTAVVRGATPPWLAGRLVAFASWTGRRRDTSQTAATLGGDNGLRGYQIGAFSVIGGNRLRANLEYRSSPLVFESVHLGGVLFYDVGSVYTSLADAQAHHAVGAGLRFLLPQFNTAPFRLDFGVPLDQKGFAVLLSYGTAQAVPLTASDDAAAATGIRPR
jgi:hypothetical protein